MRNIVFGLLAAAAVCNAAELPKAYYVKKGDDVTKYSFGVAGNLRFSDNGHKLHMEGYGETINLDEIDYISFTAPFTSSLTPNEQKDRLVKIGQEVYDLVNMHDYSDIFKAVHAFFDGYEDATGRWQYPPVEYWLDPAYYEVHGEGKAIIKSIRQAVAGNASALRVLKAKTVNLYRMEDYFGIYTANPATQTWDKTPSDHFEIRFNGLDGENFILKLTASEEFTTWNTCDFNGQFPKVVNISFSNGNTELCNARLNTTLVQDTSIDIDLHFEANKLIADDVMKVTDTLITDNVKVMIDGKEVVNITSDVNGKNLVNYDVIYDAVDAANGRHDEETDEWIEEDSSKLMALFTRGNAYADVLGKLQTNLKLFNPSRIYEDLSQDNGYDKMTIGDATTGDCYGRIISNNGNTIHIAYNDYDLTDNVVASLNPYTDANFKYDHDTKVQGYLGFDISEEIWDCPQYYGYGDDMPRLNGYTVIDNFLYRVYRDVWQEYDESKGESVYRTGSWKIYAWNETTGEDASITVENDDVIFPEMIYEHEYMPDPLLIFPDQTSFRFEDFFDENSFSTLIDDYNEIIDTYLSITGQERDDDDDY